jgi:hypothetical protein
MTVKETAAEYGHGEFTALPATGMERRSGGI